MKHVLFVCTGNTCRSPMAEEMMRRLAKEFNVDVEVRSAGVFAHDGSPASPHTQTLLRERGWDENHSSQMINEDLLNWADIVLTMTQQHKETLRSLYGNINESIYTLKEYSALLRNEMLNEIDLDIKDPFGGSLDNYRDCHNEIEMEIRNILEKWSKE